MRQHNCKQIFGKHLLICVKQVIIINAFQNQFTVMLPQHHNWSFTIVNSMSLKKKLPSSLKMIWVMIETCCGIFKSFNINILD